MIVTVAACMKHQTFGIRGVHRQIDKRNLHRNCAVIIVQQFRILPQLHFLLVLVQHGIVNVLDQIRFAVKVDRFPPDLHIFGIQHHMIGYEAFIGQGLNRRSFPPTKEPLEKGNHFTTST